MTQGRYQYLDKIGEGGMATVYRGIQTSLDRPVAIKVLSAQLSDNPSVRKRFKRESLIIARLNHPNIIHVIDKGTTSSGRPVFVMEYVEGQTLQQAIKSDKLPFNRKVDTMVQVCKGLGYAHKLGVIHRDIKPANILIDTEGNSRLLDFGIASFFKEENEGSDETRIIMGTDAYMAPEQRRGIGETSELSDIFSLGVMMYELFAKRLPEPDYRPPSFYESQLSSAMDGLITQCLAADPADRPESVEEVKNRILLAMQGQHLGQEQQDRAGEGLSNLKERFGLLDVIREDRFGAVYLYEEKNSHQLIVLKKRAGSTSGLKEAKLLTQLKHPNVVNVLGTSQKDKVFIVVMEYMTGGSLQDRLIEPLPTARFLKLALPMAEGLAFAHRNRIVHGNLRPSNVLLNNKQEPVMSDFGFDEHYRFNPDENNWYANGREAASELLDIFSLGAIYFHMLTGNPPQHKDGKLVRTKLFVELPNELQALLGRMLDKRPEERPQSIDVVLSEIDYLYEQAFGQKEKTAIKKERPKVVEQTVIRYNHRGLIGLLGLLLTASFALNVLFWSYGDEFIKDKVEQIISVFLSWL